MTEVTVDSLNEEEESITFAGAGSSSAVGVVKSTGDTPVESTAVLLDKASTSGTHFGIVTTKRGIIGYCTGTAPGAVDTIAGCTDPRW